MNRFVGTLGAATILTILALWLVPPVGLAAVAVMLVLLPPWGRSLTERAVISGVVLLGIVAVVFPRAGATPVTAVSAKVLFTVMLLGLLALRIIPALRDVRIPRPTVTDALAVVLAAASATWLMLAYAGRSTTQIVSGLFFSGWDNQAHFTTFANTYSSSSTTWPTIDGAIAWNQWYPSLHSTTWALLEKVAEAADLSRPELLWPYVQWNALTFAACLVALAWVAGDLAARIGGQAKAVWSRPIAFGAFALFGLFGSPALLYNAGFTNFMMGVTVVVVVAYVSARTLRSARVLGWFLLPLGGLAVIGLWTPLALGLVPSAIVVVIALVKYRWPLGVAWLTGSAVLAAFMALTQTNAILGVEPGQSTGDFTADLGAVGTGMVPFNLGLALAAPVIALLAVVLLVRARLWPLAVALAGPVLGSAVIALIFVGGADTAGISRLQSYYVLKPLDAMLLAIVPLLAALLGIVTATLVDGHSKATAGLSVALGGVIVFGALGYVGSTSQFSDGFSASPGVQAGVERMRGIEDPLIGESIIRAQQAATPYPDDTTLIWDGAGTLPNLWVATLHGVMSKTQQRFYRDLPPFPYESSMTGYVDLALQVNPQMRVAALWFRPSSGEVLDAWAAGRNDDRVVSVQVPMPSNLLCPECVG